MERSAANILSMGKWTRVSAWTLGIFLVLMFVVGFWASREPDIFWVNRSADPENPIVGYSTVDTLVRVAETLLDKNAGYLTNDELRGFSFGAGLTASAFQVDYAMLPFDNGFGGPGHVFTLAYRISGASE